MIVVDASIAAKWLLAETDTVAALQFVADHRRELAGPDLLFVEVASAIVRRANENKALVQDSLRALDKWTTGWEARAVAAYPTTSARLSAAGRLALQLGHPLADCIYLALAIELDCDLATCDAKFARKAGAVSQRVRQLADYAAA